MKLIRAGSPSAMASQKEAEDPWRSGTNTVEQNKCCESTKFCWWEPDPEEPNITVDFCVDTSLHGLKYICQPQRHLSERIFWVFGFIIGLFAAGWLISDIWLKYINSPVIVTFQPYETTIDQIPFPAITICNMNKVLRSKAEEYIRVARQNDSLSGVLEAKKNVFYLDHVCSTSKRFSQRFNFSLSRGDIDDQLVADVERVMKEEDDEQKDVVSFLQNASQTCPDMMLKCIWNDEIANCSDLFKPMETDFGMCCVFNMVPPSLLYKLMNDSRDNEQEVNDWAKWSAEGIIMEHDTTEEGHTHRKFPRRQVKAGKTSGLSILLNPELREYFCTSSDSGGFRLVKHSPMEEPQMDLGTAIRPNAEVFLGVKPEITLAHPSIKNFALEKRGCYFPGEMPLAYYKYYTLNNCIEECIANKTYAECDCVLYYMPRDDTRDICNLNTLNMSSSCAENVKRDARQENGAKSGCNKCLPACTELEYFSETSYASVQKGFDIWLDSANRTTKWSNNNVSIVHIFFAQDSTYARVRKELYGMVDLIANTGGILGLCLGFSGLSLIELVYFYTFRAWCRVRRRRSFWSIAANKLHRMWKQDKVRESKGLTPMQRLMFGLEGRDQEGLDSIQEMVAFGGAGDRFPTLPLGFHSRLMVERQ